MRHGRIIRCILALASLCLLSCVLFIAAPTHLLPVQAKENHHIIHHQKKHTPRMPAPCTQTTGPWGGGPVTLNAQGTEVPAIFFGAGTPIPPYLQCIPIN